MSDRAVRRLALANCVVVATLLSAGGLLTVLEWRGEHRPFSGPAIVAIPSIALLATLGYLIILRFPRHRIGVGMAALALCGSTLGFSEGYTSYALSHPGALPAASWAAWVFNWLWVWFLMAPLTLLLLHVPDGSLPSARWRPVLALDLVALALLTATQMLQPGTIEEFPQIENPLGFEALRPVLLPLNLAGFILLLPAVILSGAGLVARFRGSSGRERLQLKWLAAAAIADGLLFVFGWGIGFFGVDPWDYVSMVALCLVPAAAAVAILKHRLYDIDVIINRALVYGSLTGATVASYAGLVFALGWVASTATGQEGNEVIVAATTLIVAALFQPARRRIQAGVDRRFYRSRYDAVRTVEAFQSRLRERTDLEALRADLAGTVFEALRPSHISVWVAKRGDASSRTRRA